MYVVHPRVCGEHGIDSPDTRHHAGSSPRVRGTPTGKLAHDLGHRFIPACAGNTRRRSQRQSGQTVHPRVCGEHLQEAKNLWSMAGSSPRVRGTHETITGMSKYARFIPACAGNTQQRRTAHRHAAVHPRVCGEHRRQHHVQCWWHGSSPRVRGTQNVIEATRRLYRFIPACAGNTSHHKKWFYCVSVHPRVCGEHIRTRWWVVSRIGSSPRVRGTQRG